MSKHAVGVAIWLAVAALAFAGPVATELRGEFILWDQEQVKLDGPGFSGWLFDQSHVWIQAGGSVRHLLVFRVMKGPLHNHFVVSQTIRKSAEDSTALDHKMYVLSPTGRQEALRDCVVPHAHEVLFKK